MFEKRGKEPRQEQFWIETKALPTATPSRFYERVNETLARIDFAPEVWKICEPSYAQDDRGGRPGIDPVVYLKMLMVGFFENLRERAGDCLAVRRLAVHSRLFGLRLERCDARAYATHVGWPGRRLSRRASCQTRNCLRRSISRLAILCPGCGLPDGLATLRGAVRAQFPKITLGLGQGSAMQQPLAIAIICGLVAHLPLVLIVLPVLLPRPAG